MSLTILRSDPLREPEVQRMAVQIQGPNLYEFVHDDTKITYSPGDFDAEPWLSYSGPMGKHRFAGDEIQAYESARGLEISVVLDRVSHLRTFTLTVFVPELTLESSEELPFHTVGIRATHRRSLTGGRGAAVSQEKLEFQGMARLIEFRATEAPQLL